MAELPAVNLFGWTRTPSGSEPASRGSLALKRLGEWSYLPISVAGRYLRSNGLEAEWSPILAQDIPVMPPSGPCNGIDVVGTYPHWLTVPGLTLKQDLSEKGQPGGYAGMDGGGIVVPPIRRWRYGVLGQRGSGNLGDVYCATDNRTAWIFM